LLRLLLRRLWLSLLPGLLLPPFLDFFRGLLDLVEKVICVGRLRMSAE
jgi:hypothetical protein